MISNDSFCKALIIWYRLDVIVRVYKPVALCPHRSYAPLPCCSIRMQLQGSVGCPMTDRSRAPWVPQKAEERLERSSQILQIRTLILYVTQPKGGPRPWAQGPLARGPRFVLTQPCLPSWPPRLRRPWSKQAPLPIASGIRPIAPGPRPPGLQLHTMLQQGKVFAGKFYKINLILIYRSL
jgi:hypothetical protein